MPPSALALDHARRLYANALMRLDDSDIISRCADRRADSDSDALLRILALEVLLKCAVLLTGEAPAPDHDYISHWNQLPNGVQGEILSAARQRMPGDPRVDLSDLGRLLKAFSWLFTQGRYYPDLYKSRTLEEQHAEGEKWLTQDAPLEAARIRYRPEELWCLIHGLRAYIEPRLGDKTSF